VPAGEDEVLLDTLRGRLGLRGAKRACGHGACGACTVLVEGRPKVSCLLPTVCAAPGPVRTVESFGLGAEDGLHPVQRAILVNDALQCGYCTPGFVTSGVALYEASKAEAPPDREAVIDALEGNLCRCGAHQRLVTAIMEACAGQHEQALPLPLPTPRVDGPEKVRGEAVYTVDVQLPGQLVAKVLRSPVAHGRFLGLQRAAAEAVPGVRAVHVLVPNGGLLRYPGQEIAAVAADSEEAALAGLAALRPEIEPLPAALGFTAARGPDAPPVYTDAPAATHEAPPANEGPVLAARLAGNLRGPMTSSQLARPRGAAGRVAAATASGGAGAALIATTAVISHCALEPHAAVARWTDGRLEVWASTQSVVMLAEDLAERYDLRRSDVRVFAPYVGGAFGGKVGLSPEILIAVDLARAAGAPVGLSLDRAEELAVGGARPGAELHLQLAADAAGGLAGVKYEAFADNGVSVGVNTAMMLRLSYRSPHKDLVDFDVLSHQPPSRPMRAPGGPAAYFALEQAVDMVAAGRAEDPVALRRRWDQTPARLRLYDAVDGVPLWRDRGPARAGQGRFRRGVGLAAATWFGFLDPASQLRLDVGPEGLLASTAAQDMGNGVRSVIAAEVARVFGLPPQAVRVRLGDSDDVYGPMAAGSRCTASLGPVATDAALELRDELVAEAEARLGLRGAVADGDHLRHAGGRIPWAALFTKLPPQTVTRKRRRDPAGYFLPVAVEHSLIYDRLPGVVQVIAVEVDARLGRVRAVESWSGLSVGRIVTPELARSQVEGGVVQGISAALYEERRADPHTGRLLSAGMESYRIAGVGDAPRMAVHFDETPLDGVHGGGMGLAELATVAVTAALANAVAHATGWRPLALPLRNDRVLAGLAEVGGA
jgi:xanthine dehydrogenase YagR molybdenum-binding subunit